MLPIVLDPRALRVGVVGTGKGLAKRLELLTQAQVNPAAIFEGYLPSGEDLGVLNVLFVTGLDESASRTLAQAARRAGVLINVEDQPALCDFHVPAQVRRGDLLLTVSTGGRSPGLARVLREDLENKFGAEWEGKLDEIARLRAIWRSQGASADEISVRTRSFLANKEWLT
jgi:precorrin-2 dehydrogenase / sirohydrochlorin ferrochelatase